MNPAGVSSAISRRMDAALGDPGATAVTCSARSRGWRAPPRGGSSAWLRIVTSEDALASKSIVPLVPLDVETRPGPARGCHPWPTTKSEPDALSCIVRIGPPCARSAAAMTAAASQRSAAWARSDRDSSEHRQCDCVQLPPLFAGYEPRTCFNSLATACGGRRSRTTPFSGAPISIHQRSTSISAGLGGLL